MTTSAEDHAEVPLADPKSRLEKILGAVPRALASKAHIIWLGALGFYIVVLPLLGVGVSAHSELIGGNYMNVTSDIGACIAAGGTLHMVKRARTAEAKAAASHDLVRQLHAAVERLHQSHQKMSGDVAGLAEAVRSQVTEPEADPKAERLAAAKAASPKLRDPRQGSGT